MAAQVAAASGSGCGAACSAHELKVATSSSPLPQLVMAAQEAASSSPAASASVYGTLRSSSATPLPQAMILFRTKNADGTVAETVRVMTDAFGRFNTTELKPGTEYHVEYRWLKSRRKGYLFFRKHIRTPMKADIGTATLRANQENVITLPEKFDSVEVPEEEREADKQWEKARRG